MVVHTTQESDVTSQTPNYMNLASCNRFLDSLSNEADYNVIESDMEVATVLSSNDRGKNNYRIFTCQMCTTCI